MSDKTDNDDPTMPAPKPGPADIADPLMRHEARRAFVWLALAGALALMVMLAQSLLVIFGGIVFAALVDGGARLVGRVVPIGRSWRVALVLLGAVAFGIWLAQFAGSQISSQAAELPATIEKQTMVGVAWLRGKGIDLHVSNVQSIISHVMGSVGQLTRVVGGLIGVVTTVVLIVVIGVYIAIEPRLYRRGVAWMVPLDRREHFAGTLEAMAHALRRLLAGRLLGMAVEGVAVWVLLEIYGVPMAALLGLITALLAFLPNIGALISGVLMTMVGFSGGTEMGLYTVGVYSVVQAVDGYVIVPMIARRTVDLPPALVLGAQLIMGVLFGLLGLVLADPMVAMIKVWLERSAEQNEAAQAGSS